MFRTVNNRNEYLVEETSFFIKITKESKNTANIYVIKDSKEYKYKVKSCFSSYKAYNKNILFKRLKKDWNSMDVSLLKLMSESGERGKLKGEREGSLRDGVCC